jgi:1A family penicillin-binding protein
MKLPLSRAFFPFKTSITFVLVLLLLLSAFSLSAIAQEVVATSPFLPAGYSSIRVFDSHGKFAGRILPDKRFWVTIDRIPRFLQNALVAVEDSRFYEHGGIDIRGIARAIVKDVAKGRLAEGGSTITQQLIKNKLLSGEKTLDRKLKEARLAIEYEQRYTKRQILEMYFNEIYFGNGAWGIAQAARIYFDKNPEELTEAECSLLAGVPKNPGRYNPLGKAALVTTRRDVVLKRMVELNMITPEKQRYLRSHPAAVVPPNQAPWYLAHIRNTLIERYGQQVVDQGGIDVTSAMDLNLQKVAERTLRDGVGRISKQLQGALICLDAGSGDVLAAVGGVEYTPGAYDRAFIARRQPGSAIKPFIYGAALEMGMTAATVMDDTPVAYDRGNGEAWRPRNYGGEEYGKLTLRQALAHSNNVITVKLLDAIGVPYFTRFAGEFGLSLPEAGGLSLGLGTAEVSLKDLALAYAPLANGGSRPLARTIIRIYNRARKSFSEEPQMATPSVSPATAFVVTQMLRDVMEYGTAKNLRKFARKHPSAGKTGTTDDYRDAWFVGYTPRLVTGVWVGYDRPKTVGRGFTGGAVAAPIWERFMETALAKAQPEDFQKPDGVTTLTIDPETGLLARSGCPEKQEEYFIAGSEPNEYCTVHGGEPLAPLPAPPLPGDGANDLDGNKSASPDDTDSPAK